MSIEDKLYKFLAIYKRMPDWMKRVITTPFTIFPREKYLGGNYKMFFELASKMDYFNPSLVEEFQYLKIKQVLEESYKHVPYYRDKWNEYGIDINSIKSISDFEAKIPFIERAEIQEKPYDFLSVKYNKNKYLKVSSGGSTGIPLELFYLKGYTRSADRAFWNYYFNQIGYKQGDRIARLRGDYIGQNKLFSFDPYRNTLILSSFSLTEENAALYIQSIQKHKVEYITAYPASCMNLVGFLKDEKFSFPHLKGIMLGSENIYDFQVNQIKEFFGVENVFKGYGHGEATVVAGSCKENDNYHFHPAYGYVEFVKSNVLKDDTISGIREIVGTSFINPLMPLIRYKSNDFGVELNTTCSCRRTTKSLKEIIGREQEVALGFNNERITLTALVFGRHLDYFSHIWKMQIINKEPGVLIVNVIPKKTFTKNHKNEIEQSLSIKSGMPFNTKVVTSQEIKSTKRGKYKFLIREF